MKRGASFGNTDKTLTVRVPLTIGKRGGRRLVLAPEGVEPLSRRTRIDNSMIKTLARAFRWRKLMESGTHTTVKAIAAAEEIDPSYIGRILRLTLLAPDIIEAILDGRQWPALTQSMTQSLPIEWGEQRVKLRG